MKEKFEHYYEKVFDNIFNNKHFSDYIGLFLLGIYCVLVYLIHTRINDFVLSMLAGIIVLIVIILLITLILATIVLILATIYKLIFRK